MEFLDQEEHVKIVVLRSPQICHFPTEQVLFSCFQISLTSLLNNKMEIFWQKGLQPSEMNKMPYWEFEEWVFFFNKRNKEENEKNKEQKNEE